MKKTLSMGAFTELDEREVMETEGGILLADPSVRMVINDPRSALANIVAGAVAGISGGLKGVAFGVCGGVAASYIDGSISTERDHTTSQTRSSTSYLLIPPIL